MLDKKIESGLRAFSLQNLKISDPNLGAFQLHFHFTTTKRLANPSLLDYVRFITGIIFLVKQFRMRQICFIPPTTFLC